MATIRCTLCNAKKEIIGMGNLRKECPRCEGIGYIKSPEEEKEVKRGRPKKEEANG